MADTYTPALTDEQIDQVRRSMKPWQRMTEYARAIERAAIEAYQRQQKESAERLFAAVRPHIAEAAAQGRHVVETPFGPAFLSLTGDCPDLPTATVDNPMENPMTDSHQPTKASHPGRLVDPKPGTFRIVFDAPGCNFEACWEAEAWCEERGISVGSMERDQPRGLQHEDCIIAKWHNLRPHERAELDGTMTGDMRSGPVTIELKGAAKDYPILDEKDCQ
ncbi:hypothetical protein [Castellaniella sp. UC4442_H9]